MPVFWPRRRSAESERPFMRTDTVSGISPARICVSSGSWSFARAGEKAEGDLRGGAVMGDAESAAARVDDLDRLAGLDAVAAGNVAGEDPGVAGGGAVGRLAVDTDFVHRIAWRRAMRSSVEG